MELKQAIFDRRSIRKYEEKEVPAELVTELLEAARQAPVLALHWRTSF